MSQLDASATADLIALCVAGDPSAKAEFCQIYSGLIRGAVQYRFSLLEDLEGTVSEVEDIYHEIIVRIFDDDCRAMRRIKEPRSVNAWLITVTRNHVITYLRKHATQTQALAVHARELATEYGADLGQNTIQNEERARLQSKLSMLSPQDRLIIELYFVQNLTYAEIAEMLGLNINTASARLRRSKAKLRKLLEEEEHELQP